MSKTGDVSDLAVSSPAVPAVRIAYDSTALDRLPGTDGTDPFLSLAAAFLAAYPPNSARAYRNDLLEWASWCASQGVHPLDARRHHADAWVRLQTTEPLPTTGGPAAAATVARRLSAVAKFYDYAIHDAEVLTYSPVGNVRRPKVSDESSPVGLSADELRRVIAAAATHSPRSSALVSLLILNGLRIPRP